MIPQTNSITAVSNVAGVAAMTATAMKISNVIRLLCIGVFALSPAMAVAQDPLSQAKALYSQGDYRRAAQKYEEALAIDPANGEAYFFLGNSYDQMYKPSRKGEPDNDTLLTKAVENYAKAVRLHRDARGRTLALEYLVGAYGPDKLNDPARAVPLAEHLIALDPTDPSPYFVLAKIDEDTGNYDHAEHTSVMAKQARPTDAAPYLQLAAYYNRQGEFEKTIETLDQRAQLEPANPEAHYTIATYYWDKAYRDFRLANEQKGEYIERGLAAVDRALSLKDDYMEALVYKNLLLRIKAILESDPEKRRALTEEADRLRDRARGMAVRRNQ
jgi:tetratricopeptide (TPR) repeat protein